jgi:hypothetical protein
MNKALRSILSVCMALALVGCGVVPVRPAEGSSAPAITIEDQYDIPGKFTSVFTYCRNGDYIIYMDTSTADTLQMVPELNERCKD